MELSVATFMKDNAPSYHLRFRSVFEALKKNGRIAYHDAVRSLLGKYRRISFKKETDIIYIARITDPDYLKRIFDYASDKRLPVIYETDDLLLFDRRKDEPADDHHVLAGYLAEASGIFTSTQYLSDELKKYNSGVFLFPNLLDPGIWDTGRRDIRRNGGALNICCIGTGIMPENLKFIVPSIEYCRKTYGRDVMFHLWGNDRYIGNNVRKFDNVKLVDGKVPYKKFAGELQKSLYDIAVVPLSDTHFNRAKSNIKYLEYAISGIPAIFSRVEPYKLLPDGQGCVIVENDPDAWRDRTVGLIESEESRLRLSDYAFKDVLGNYMLNEKWAEFYLSVLNKFYGR